MYASDKFVVSEAQRLVAMKIPTKLSALPQITPEDVCQAAAEGDQYAREILVKQGSNSGLGLRNVVNLLNPGPSSSAASPSAAESLSWKVCGRSSVPISSPNINKI